MAGISSIRVDASIFNDEIIRFAQYDGFEWSNASCLSMTSSDDRMLRLAQHDGKLPFQQAVEGVVMPEGAEAVAATEQVAAGVGPGAG